MSWRDLLAALRGVAIALLTATILALFVRTFVVSLVEVRSTSMTDTLLPGDHLLVSRLITLPGRGIATPRLRHRDVVLFRRPVEPHRDFIKRVVALPGERVSLDHRGLVIDGRLIDEGRKSSATKTNGGGDLEAISLGEDQVIVLGDARGQSRDSRHFGPIDGGWIKGRAVLIIFSTADSEPPSQGDWGTILGRLRATSSRADRWLRPIR